MSEAGLFHLNLSSLLGHWLRSILCNTSILSQLIELSDVLRLKGLFVGFFELLELSFPLDVGLEVLILNPDPLISVHFSGVEGEFDFLVCECTVLAESVEADHILDVLSQVFSWLYFFPMLLVWHEFFTFFNIIFFLFLLLFPDSLLFLLLSKFLLHNGVVLDCTIVRLNRQA